MFKFHKSLKTIFLLIVILALANSQIIDKKLVAALRLSSGQKEDSPQIWKEYEGQQYKIFVRQGAHLGHDQSQSESQEHSKVEGQWTWKDGHWTKEIIQRRVISSNDHEEESTEDQKSGALKKIQKLSGRVSLRKEQRSDEDSSDSTKQNIKVSVVEKPIEFAVVTSQVQNVNPSIVSAASSIKEDTKVETSITVQGQDKITNQIAPTNSEIPSAPSTETSATAPAPFSENPIPLPSENPSSVPSSENPAPASQIPATTLLTTQSSQVPATAPISEAPAPLTVSETPLPASETASVPVSETQAQASLTTENPTPTQNPASQNPAPLSGIPSISTNLIW